MTPIRKKRNRKPSWFMSAAHCPYCGLPITHAKTFSSTGPGDPFSADMARLGTSIMLVQCGGYASSAAETAFLASADDFTRKHFSSQDRIVYVEDYSDITGADAEARKQYIHYFLNNRNRFYAFLFYNLPPIFRISFNLFNKLHAHGATVLAVKTYEQAIDLALQLPEQPETDLPKPDAVSPPASGRGIRARLQKAFNQVLSRAKGRGFSFIQKIQKRLADPYSDVFLQSIAAIDWQTPGMPPPHHLFADRRLPKNLYDAIGFVKSEVDTLMAERASAEQVLQTSETRYRLLVEHAKAGFMEYDFTTDRITSVNDELISMTGYSRDDLLSMNPRVLISDAGRELYSKRLKAIRAGERLPPAENYPYLTKNGESRWIRLNSNVTYDNHRPRHAAIVVTDITSLKQTEQKLLDYQDKLKRLSVRMSMAEEKHRRNLASVLHETIGQELFVMQMQLAAFERSFSDPTASAPLQKIQDQLIRIIRQTRNLTQDLSPPVLYDFGLDAAVSALARSLQQKHGICIRTFFNDEEENPDEKIKVIHYRNIKELILNVIKHAGAKNITIWAKHSDSGFCVAIHDDGMGFDSVSYFKESATHQGFGLFDVREKLNHLGGRLLINSAPGQGTSIRMQVPPNIPK